MRGLHPRPLGFSISNLVRFFTTSLGWYQFEWLIQALLKAELGLGVQSWGGHGDWGRDAYSPGPPPFPARDTATEGPFIFQAKFVSGANAAGAKSGLALLQLVKIVADQLGCPPAAHLGRPYPPR